MFDLKLQFLADQNFALRRQITSLQHIISAESQQSHRSLQYQLIRLNSQLENELQKTRDQLLLDREALEIERVEHQRIVHQLNRSIFELNEQIVLLENIVKEEKKYEYQPNFIQKWIKRKMDNQQSQIYHLYANPLLFFEIMEGILQLLEGQEKQQQHMPVEIEQTLSNLLQKTQYSKLNEVRNSEVTLNEEEVNRDNIFKQSYSSFGNKLDLKTEWKQQRSSLYFLKKKKIKDLHLNLKSAKMVQMNYIEAQQKKEGIKPMISSNVELLRKSYVELVGLYHISKKKIGFLEHYIQELQNRNVLLLRSRLEVPVDQ